MACAVSDVHLSGDGATAPTSDVMEEIAGLLQELVDRLTSSVIEEVKSSDNVNTDNKIKDTCELHRD